MTDLERQFHGAMIDIYKVAQRECNYTATYFLRMVSEEGGVVAAKQLLAKDQVSDGFGTLWMCGRLDLTVEAHVIRPEFQSLFTPDEIVIARSRLNEYGYQAD